MSVAAANSATAAWRAVLLLPGGQLLMLLVIQPLLLPVGRATAAVSAGRAAANAAGAHAAAAAEMAGYCFCICRAGKC